jgi:methylisocitrate lyase
MYHSEMTKTSPGRRLRDAVEAERPLQVAGAINAYAALLAEKSGFRALYLSGAGVANASFGLPDLGMTGLADVCEDARRVCGATELPLLVDADTGFGAALSISRTRFRRSVVGTGPARRWSPRPKWRTASGPRWMRAPKRTS